MLVLMLSVVQWYCRAEMQGLMLSVMTEGGSNACNMTSGAMNSTSWRRRRRREEVEEWDLRCGFTAQYESL